jgi:hypothetical protein
MTRNKWHRTDLNGEIAPDDWTLLAIPSASRSLASTKSSAARRMANGIGPFYSCQTAA